QSVKRVDMCWSAWRVAACSVAAFAACSSSAGDDAGGAPDTTTVSDALSNDVADDDAQRPDVAADTTQADTTPPPMPIGCGTAAYARPSGVVEMAYDSGVPLSSVPAQSWSITTNGTEYSLSDGPVWEAVRFDLAGPARVWGFSIQWAQPPSDPAAELAAGLYADYGHNGFDFWRDAALAAGTRCASEVVAGEWLDYVLTTPLEVVQPGLLYVAQRRAGATEPAFVFDDVAIEDCDPFEACHSGLNLPEAETRSFDIGLSFPLGRNFMVRLLVEPSTEPAPVPRFVAGPELTLGNRYAWGDYDRDGDDDLMTNGPRLLQNDGQGGFTDVTAAAGMGDAHGSGGVWGDFDNDGCLDVFLYTDGLTVPDALWRSDCDGTFSDITVSAGLIDTQDYNACDTGAEGTKNPSPGAAWVDLDADGFLDLYVSNFICWSNYTFYTDTIFRNNGDGTFSDWTATRGFSHKRTPSRGVSPIDADRDGDVDLLVNNYVLAANQFYDNQGDGTFIERGAQTGLAGVRTFVNLVSRYGHTIGSAWGDVDGDGDFDAVLANLAHPRFNSFSDKTQLMLNNGAGAFQDANGGAAWTHGTSPAGLRYQETHSVPALADFNGDGALDLIITAIYAGRPTDFYWGRGDGTFELDLLSTGITTSNGWGIAVADVDNDGDVDVVAKTLFENRGGADDGHWVSVKVVGDAGSNYEAIGATVAVEAGGVTALRHVQGGTGQGCQDSSYLLVGLGETDMVDRVSVTFPGGKTVNYEGPWSADQRLWLSESGGVATGWAPPVE
ncbi:MAG: hypothetical protein ACI9MR_002313, partial [Myxococcota bacterium]